MQHGIRLLDKAKELLASEGKKFAKVFGREHKMVEPYKCDDAETVLIVSSTIASTAKDAIDELRDEGHQVLYRHERPKENGAVRVLE